MIFGNGRLSETLFVTDSELPVGGEITGGSKTKKAPCGTSPGAEFLLLRMDLFADSEVRARRVRARRC